MSCCSYFDGNGNCIEEMVDHIKLGLKLIEKRFLKRRYAELLAGRLGIPTDEAEDILKLSYVLHDVGKGLECFQRRRGSFQFHEQYSYLIALETLSEFGLAGRVASIAILIHHHDWVRKNFVENKEIKIFPDCAAVFEEWISIKVPHKYGEYSPLIDFTSKLSSVYTILLPLMLADNYAAMINRGGRGSMLGREALASSRFYGVLP